MPLPWGAFFFKDDIRFIGRLVLGYLIDVPGWRRVVFLVICAAMPGAPGCMKCINTLRFYQS